MNYKDVSAKVRKIADKTLTQNDLAKNVIIKRGNKYQAYSEYHIQEMPTSWQVTTDFSDKIYEFNTAKTALAWCIAYKTGRYELAKTIETLDHRLSAKQVDIDILSYYLHKGVEDPDTQFIYQSRLSEDINSRQFYKKQLVKCLNSAKYIKIKGSSHELNRFNKTG
jgi:hypothetical protein